MKQKVIFNSAAMVKALEYCKKIMLKNAPVCIIEDFRIGVKGSRIEISGTDLQTFINVGFNGDASEQTNFETVLPFASLNYLKKLELQPVVLEYIQENETILLHEEGGTAKYAGQKAEDFPINPDVDKPVLTLSPSELKELDDLLNYISRDALRPAMCGIGVIYYEGKLNLVGTDGTALKVVTLPGHEDPERNREQLFIINERAARLLNSFKIDGSIQINANKERIQFTFKTGPFDIEVSTRNIDERYPEFWNVIPEKNSTFLTFKTKPFLKTLDKAMTFVNKSTKAVRLLINGELLLCASDIDFDNEYTAAISGQYKGEQITIGFNAEYLKKVIESYGDEITLELSAPNKAGVIKSETSTCLLMPIMLADYE